MGACVILRTFFSVFFVILEEIQSSFCAVLHILTISIAPIYIFQATSEYKLILKVASYADLSAEPWLTIREWLTWLYIEQGFLSSEVLICYFSHHLCQPNLEVSVIV